MVQFGYLYINAKLTIYDVTLEVRHGRIVHVASLSEDPSINFAAIRLDSAVQQLTAFLRYREAQLAMVPVDVRRFPPRTLKQAM